MWTGGALHQAPQASMWCHKICISTFIIPGSITTTSNSTNLPSFLWDYQPHHPLCHCQASALHSQILSHLIHPLPTHIPTPSDPLTPPVRLPTSSSPLGLPGISALHSQILSHPIHQLPTHTLPPLPPPTKWGYCPHHPLCHCQASALHSNSISPYSSTTNSYPTPSAPPPTKWGYWPHHPLCHCQASALHSNSISPYSSTTNSYPTPSPPPPLSEATDPIIPSATARHLHCIHKFYLTQFINYQLIPYPLCPPPTKWGYWPHHPLCHCQASALHSQILSHLIHLLPTHTLPPLPPPPSN